MGFIRLPNSSMSIASIEAKGIFSLWSKKALHSNLNYLGFNFLTMGTAFYGLLFNLSKLGLNPYVSAIIFYLVNISAKISTVPIIGRIGYKNSLRLNLTLCGISLLICHFTKGSSFAFIVLITGVFGISSILISLNTFTSDIFDSANRTSVLSFCTALARIGSILGSMMIEITNYSLLVFGAMSIISAYFIMSVKMNNLAV